MRENFSVKCKLHNEMINWWLEGWEQINSCEFKKTTLLTEVLIGLVSQSSIRPPSNTLSRAFVVSRPAA